MKQAPALRQHLSLAAAGTFRVLDNPDLAPVWAVKFGGEFWRRHTPGVPGEANALNASTPANPAISLADPERVTHTLDTDPATGLPQISAENYVARLDEQGVQFWPAKPGSMQAAGAIVAAEGGPPVADPATQIRFRTSSIERDGQTYFSASQNPTQWMVIGNTMQGLLAPSEGIVEHFESGNTGVAVTWVFQEPLPGNGPIEISATMDGLKYAGQTDLGEHFADNSGMARVYLGQAEAVDSLGNRWALTTYPPLGSSNSLVVQLPAAIQDEAVYPLVVDPVIGPEFGVDKPVCAVCSEQSMPNNQFVTGNSMTGAPSTANLTVQFSAPAYSATKSSKFAIIAITVTGKYSGEFTVDLATADGTAVAGRDYMPVAGRLVFSNKKISATALIPIIDDGTSEPNKTINLTLQNPMGGVLLGARPTATLTIAE